MWWGGKVYGWKRLGKGRAITQAGGWGEVSLTSGGILGEYLGSDMPLVLKTCDSVMGLRSGKLD